MLYYLKVFLILIPIIFNINAAQISLGEQLFNASKIGATEVKKLLISGAPVDYVDKSSGETALFNAARKGNLIMINTLKSSGANLDKQNNSGQTALIVSIIHDKFDAAQQLFLLGANPDIPDNDGNTAKTICPSRPLFQINPQSTFYPIQNIDKISPKSEQPKRLHRCEIDDCSKTFIYFTSKQKHQIHIIEYHISKLPWMCRTGCNNKFNDQASRDAHEKVAHK